MKKILLLCLVVLFALSAAVLAACGTTDGEPSGEPSYQEPSGEENPGEENPGEENPGEENPPLQTFTGITFTNKTVTYDGTEHTISIAGTLPDGAKTEYANNAATNAGTYKAKATVSKEGYQTLELTATLTIEKAAFTGITLESKTVIYDGEEHSLAVEGELPQGTTVRYENNGKTEGGEYTVKAFVENPNYNTLELTAILRIRTLLDAKDIIDGILQRPDAWSFMPDAFLPENMQYSALPEDDFSSFVSVDAIGKRVIGKQMNVVYDILTQVQSILSKADFVFAAGEAIAAAYQTFINDNPDDYSEFTGSITLAGIPLSAKIALQDTASVLLLGNDTVSIELRADSDSGRNTGRIQIAGAVLKYEAGKDFLQLAVNLEISGVKVAWSLEFARTDGAVAGYVYEYYGIGSAAIKTTALITSNDSLTIVTGNKRESDDLLIEAYEEVYSSQTGEMIGGEVTETVKLADFDTLWFPLHTVQGIETVKVENVKNGSNADTVYVNGSADPFATKTIGGFGLDSLSRRYDIEMKEVWYIVATETDGKITYSSEKTAVPMLFVQKKSLSDFADDVTEENDTVLLAALPDTTVITSNFTSMSESYLALKELMTYEEIEAFIGENDPFFSQQQQ